ncbi:MAG TPA: rhodanese-like domain-containing protein [Acidimicrobiales bacterium]
MSQIENVDVARALELLDEGALLLDVREDDEWHAGHAAVARHIALSAVPDSLDDLAKNRRIVCVCRSGGRSARAGQFLAEQGFDVVNLDGGMTAWHAAGVEMVSEDGEPTVA